MALVNTERKFIYLFEPNTRSTLVEDALKILPGSSVIDGNRYSSLAAILANSDITQEQADTYRIFCTVRNPYDSFIARTLKRDSKMTVESFLSDPLLSIRYPMVLYPGNGLYEEATDFVWFEHIVEDILDLFDVTIREPKKTHLSGNKDMMWQDYYVNKPFRHILRTSASCRSYMRRFGYEFSRDETRVTSKVSSKIREPVVNNRKPI